MKKAQFKYDNIDDMQEDEPHTGDLMDVAYRGLKLDIKFRKGVIEYGEHIEPLLLALDHVKDLIRQDSFDAGNIEVNGITVGTWSYYPISE